MQQYFIMLFYGLAWLCSVHFLLVDHSIPNIKPPRSSWLIGMTPWCWRGSGRRWTCAIHGKVLRFFHGEQMADDCGSMDVIFNGFQSKSEIETPKDSDFPQKKGFLGTRDQQFFGDQERSSSRALLRRKHRGSGPGTCWMNHWRSSDFCQRRSWVKL
jgi:hypothetical protein